MNAVVRLYRGENDIDFVKWWPRFLVVSAVVVVLSIGSLFVRGLNLGIDFEGGNSWEVQTSEVSVGAARDVLRPLGAGDAKIQIVGTDILRVQAKVESAETQTEVRDALAELAGVDPAEVAFSTVGPSWGDQITRSAITALVVFFLAILLYLTLRLELRMAVGAIVAVVHDIVIAVGVYSIFQFEVTPATVISFLTILGFSIYDTVVVFDKVRENQARPGLTGRLTYTELMSLSMNQVLLRSINTSVVGLLPVLSMLLIGALLLGAVTLLEFGIALFVGLLIGAYSSVFIAAPVTAWLKEHEPQNRRLRERLEANRALADQRTGATEGGDVVSAPAPERPRSTTTRTATASPAVSTNIPPRPRKKGKKR
ncbi:MAG: protein translocase subunit SecF [Acidimicrobiales bacterium]|jgi:preprotein translocase subunit SecF|nr:protein translocase subunit SecF [Acidimicrobiales bacterium]